MRSNHTNENKRSISFYSFHVSLHYLVWHCSTHFSQHIYFLLGNRSKKCHNFHLVGFLHRHKKCIDFGVISVRRSWTICIMASVSFTSAAIFLPLTQEDITLIHLAAFPLQKTAANELTSLQISSIPTLVSPDVSKHFHVTFLQPNSSQSVRSSTRMKFFEAGSTVKKWTTRKWFQKL